MIKKLLSPILPYFESNSIFAEHPETGEDVCVHRNWQDLISDEDFQDAGFEWVDGDGWCYPFYVNVGSYMFYNEQDSSYLEFEGTYYQYLKHIKNSPGLYYNFTDWQEL